MSEEELKELGRQIMYDLYRICKASMVDYARWKGIVDDNGKIKESVILYRKPIKLPSDMQKRLQEYHDLKQPDKQDHVFDIFRTKSLVKHLSFY